MRCDGSCRSTCRAGRWNGAAGSNRLERPAVQVSRSAAGGSSAPSIQRPRRRAFCPACRWPMRGRKCRGSTVAPADPEGDAAALLRLAQWCGRYSPWTVPHGPDSILLDITGCAHLAGGEDRLGAELLERLARRGITGTHRHRRHDRRRLGGGACGRAAGRRRSRRARRAQRLAPLPVRALAPRREICARRWSGSGFAASAISIRCRAPISRRGSTTR